MLCPEMIYGSEYWSMDQLWLVAEVTRLDRVSIEYIRREQSRLRWLGYIAGGKAKRAKENMRTSPNKGLIQIKFGGAIFFYIFLYFCNILFKILKLTFFRNSDFSTIQFFESFFTKLIFFQNLPLQNYFFQRFFPKLNFS